MAAAVRAGDGVTGATLVTGADGYLGSRVAAALSARGSRVVPWVRAASASDRERKIAAVTEALGPAVEARDVRFGDLTDDALFSGVDPSSLSAIVHSAAVTRFNVDAATADAVNVRGAARVFEFAERCPRLERLVFLSTLYASGLSSGPVEEAPLPEPLFANEYERSKWAAETELISRHPDLPWVVLRVATAIADNDAGEIRQHNAVHNTLQLLYYGFISTLPGAPGTPVYLVTGDLAVEAALAALDRGRAGTICHVAHRRDQSLRLGELVDVAFSAFEEDPQFRRKRVPKPLFVDQGSFELLRKALSGFAGGVVNEAIASVAPFAAQMFVEKDVRNARFVSLLGRDPATDAARLAREACRTLLRTRFRLPAPPAAAAAGKGRDR